MMLLSAGIDSSRETRALKVRASGPESTVRDHGASAAESLQGATASQEVSFAVGNTEDKLSLAAAMKQGYRIVLDTDGEGEVTNPWGRTYYVSGFECDCPDKRSRNGSYGNRCKHELWISQMRPCDCCGGTMLLGEFRTAFGETLRRFECPVCGNARDLALVEEERAAARNSAQGAEECTPETRCRQALASLKVWDSPRHIWGLLEESPRLAATMLSVLLEEGHRDLADEVSQKYSAASKVA